MAKLNLQNKENLSESVNAARLAIAKVGNANYGKDDTKKIYRNALKTEVFSKYNLVDVSTALKDISGGKSAEAWEYFVEGNNAILEFVAEGGVQLNNEQVLALTELQNAYNELQDENTTIAAQLADAKQREAFMREQGRANRLYRQLVPALQASLERAIAENKQQRSDFVNANINKNQRQQKQKEHEINLAVQAKEQEYKNVVLDPVYDQGYADGEKAGKKSGSKKWKIATFVAGGVALATVVGLISSLAKNVEQSNTIDEQKETIDNKQDTIDNLNKELDKLNKQLAKYGAFVETVVDYYGENGITTETMKDYGATIDDYKLSYGDYTTTLSVSGNKQFTSDKAKALDHTQFDRSTDNMFQAVYAIDAVVLEAFKDNKEQKDAYETTFGGYVYTLAEDCGVWTNEEGKNYVAGLTSTLETVKNNYNNLVVDYEDLLAKNARENAPEKGEGEAVVVVGDEDKTPNSQNTRDARGDSNYEVQEVAETEENTNENVEVVAETEENTTTEEEKEEQKKEEEKKQQTTSDYENVQEM